MGTQQKLKVGILLDRQQQPRGVVEILHAIEQSGFAEVSGIRWLDQAQRAQNTSFRGIGRLIYRFHEWVDRKLYFKKEALGDSLGTETWLKSYPSCSATAAAKDSWDVALNFSHADMLADVFPKPTYGVWVFRQNFLSPTAAEPPGYWQTTQCHPETVTALWQLGLDRDSLLYASSQITDYHAINKSRDRYYKRMKLILLRVLGRLAAGGASYFQQQIHQQKGNAQGFYQAQTIRHTVSQSLKNLATHLRTLLTAFYQNIFFLDHWHLLFQWKKTGTSDTDFQHFTPIPSPKDRFWADPFVERRGQYHYVFVEEWMYAQRKGRLAVVQLDLAGRLVESKPILERSYHLSYPYVFQYQGEDFMIPETKENRQVDLYKCVRFPYEWRLEKTLKHDIQAVDVTPFYHQSKWWIFCNIDESDGQSSINDELFLFYCDDLFHDAWVSHPMNPVISDVKRARPAGKIFEKKGKLYRPSQDCSMCYGSALNMNEIITLSTTDYQERLVKKYRPHGPLKRLHTYNSNPDLTVVDSFYFRRR